MTGRPAAPSLSDPQDDDLLFRGDDGADNNCFQVVSYDGNELNVAGPYFSITAALLCDTNLCPDLHELRSNSNP